MNEPPNQNPPETKGMTVKATIKAEVDHALDLIVHNHNIPWPRVTAALKRVVNVIDASGRESYGHTADSAREAAVQRERDAAVKWRERAEKAEERANKADADFEQMRKALSESVETVSRLKKQVEDAPDSVGEHKRVFALVAPIVKAMLEHFRPATESPLFGDEGADPKAFDADGVAYGEKLDIGNLRYGDLEVAYGALMGLAPGERLIEAIFAHPRPVDDGSTL